MNDQDSECIFISKGLFKCLMKADPDTRCSGDAETSSRWGDHLISSAGLHHPSLGTAGSWRERGEGTALSSETN